MREREIQKAEVRGTLFLRWATGFLPCFPFPPSPLLRVNCYIKWQLSIFSIQYGKGNVVGNSQETCGNHTWFPGMAQCLSAQLIPMMAKLLLNSLYFSVIKKVRLRRAENYTWKHLSWSVLEEWGKEMPFALARPPTTLLWGLSYRKELTVLLPLIPQTFLYQKRVLKGWQLQPRRLWERKPISALCLPEGWEGNAKWPRSKESGEFWHQVDLPLLSPFASLCPINTGCQDSKAQSAGKGPSLSYTRDLFFDSYVFQPQVAGFQFCHYSKWGYCLLLVILT